jgi:hypothetical protein
LGRARLQADDTAAAISESVVDASAVAHALLACLLRQAPLAELATLMNIFLGGDGINLYLRL